MISSEILLIDIGNSFIKFASISAKAIGQKNKLNKSIEQSLNYFEKINHQSNHFLSQFEQFLEKKKFNQVSIVSVASQGNIKEGLIAKLKQHKFCPKVLISAQSQKVFKNSHYQLINGYENPMQLGTDRWLAMIAALFLHHQQSSKPTINRFAVIDLGSVISIDFVEKVKFKSGIYQYLGGLLVPNYQLNRESLGEKMPLRFDENYQIKVEKIQSQSYGKNTEDCIEAGFIQGLKQLLENHPLVKKSQKIYLTGGSLDSFMQVIRTDSKYASHCNLVLLGLLIQSLELI